MHTHAESFKLHRELCLYLSHAQAYYPNEHCAFAALIQGLIYYFAADEDEMKKRVSLLIEEQETAFDRMMAEDSTIDPNDYDECRLELDKETYDVIQALKSTIDGNLTRVIRKGLFLLCAVEQITNPEPDAMLSFGNGLFELRSILYPDLHEVSQDLH